MSSVQGADANSLESVSLTFDDGNVATVRVDAAKLHLLQTGDVTAWKQMRESVFASSPGTKGQGDDASKRPEATTSKGCQEECPQSTSAFKQVGPLSHKKLKEKRDTPPKYWSNSEAKILLSARLNMEDEFQNMTRHDKLWGNIARSMAENQTVVTADQCRNKFKAMKREWKTTVDHNSKSGNDRKDCLFYNEFNEVYGTKPSTIPDFTLSSLSGASTSSAVGVDVVDLDDSSTGSSSDVKPEKKKRKISSTSKKDKSVTMEWLQGYEERQLLFRERQLDCNKNMHKEKCSLMERLIGVLEKQ